MDVIEISQEASQIVACLELILSALDVRLDTAKVEVVSEGMDMDQVSVLVTLVHKEQLMLKTQTGKYCTTY